MKISREVKVGLLSTSALIIIYLGLNFLKGRDIMSSSNIYHTTYATSEGLGTSSPVVVNGMIVGRVRSIKILPDQKHSALVTFATDKDITLTDATKARLVSRNLWGGKAIELFIEPGDPLKKYDNVPGEVEEGLGEAFVNTALPALNDAKDISRLASQFLVSLNENTDKINNVLSNLEVTTRKLKQTVNVNQAGINKVTQNLTTFSDVIADGKSGMGPLLTKLNQLMEGIEGQEAKIATTKLNNILGSLEQMLDKTGERQSSLIRLMDDDALYNNLNQTLVDLDQLLVDVRAHPWRYVSFSVFGGGQSREERAKK